MASERKDRTVVLDKKKLIIGLIAGVLLCGVSAVFFSLKAGAALFIGFAAVGAVRLNIHSGKWFRILRAVWLCAAVICTAEVSQMLADGRHLWELRGRAGVIDVLCAAILFLVIGIIVGEIRAAWLISTFIVLLFSLVNSYVVRFRGKAMLPHDIFSAGTALTVAHEYKLFVTVIQFYGMALILLVFFSSFCISDFSTRQVKRRIPLRLVYGILLIPAFLAAIFGLRGIKIETWHNEGAVYNGFLANFSAQILDEVRDKTPENYSPEAITELENKYIKKSAADSGNTGAGKAGDSGRQPNIIVIMDESFADLHVLGEKFNTKEEITPFYDGLSENVIKGYALSSVFGGGTANSEYEFLTGNTMGYLSEGATVYQLYLNDYSFSMASHLKNCGYRCIATHPFSRKGWSRTKAWPYLGFESITFMEEYPQKDLVRDYISDREAFEYIAELCEKKEDDRPLFIFSVTMQNHGGYDYTGSGRTPVAELENYDQRYPDAEQYLGLLHETDSALQWLIDYFRESDEETVICFFGDHLPNLNQSFYRETHGGNFETLAEQELQQTVPFFVWANYDIEEKEVPLTSLNYLSNYVYEAAGMELPPYNQFLLDTEKIVPAVNAKGYYSLSARTFLPFEEASGSEREALQRYEILQYNSVFESDDRSGVFFGTIE